MQAGAQYANNARTTANTRPTDMDARLCPRICIAGLHGRPLVTAEQVHLDGDRPVIRLSLRKPRAWGWKLTTSESSPAVVCVVDDNGNLLGDRNINLAPTALDTSRHWNERANQGSSTESEAETERDVRRHRRKNDSGYKSLRRPRSSGPDGGRSSVGRRSEREHEDSSGRRGKEIDTRTSSLRRGKEVDNRDSSGRRGKEIGTRTSSLRRGKEVDNRDSSGRRGKEIDTRMSSLRRGKEVDNRDSSGRRGKEIDTRTSSLRTGKEVDNKDSSLRRGNDIETRSSSVRRRDGIETTSSSVRRIEEIDRRDTSVRRRKERDNRDTSLRRRKDIEPAHSSVRKGKGTDTVNSSFRRRKERDNEDSAARRGKEIDTRTSSVREREEKEPALSSVRKGKDNDAVTSSFRREETDTGHTSFTSGKVPKSGHTSLRRVREMDSKHSSLRRVGEMDSTHSSLRRGNEMDSKHSSLRRGNEMDSKHCSLRRGNEMDSKHSSLRRGNEMDSKHSSLRRGNEMDSKHSSLRRGNEMDSKHSSLRRGNEMDSKHSSLRRGNEMDSKHSSLRRGNEMDSKHSSLRRGSEMDSTHSSLRRGNEMDSKHSSLRRGNEMDSTHSSLRRGNEMDSTHSSLRRGKDADVGYSSLTRGKESPMVNDAESIRRGRRKNRSDSTLGVRDDEDAATGRPPPRRPRRRRRSALRAMGSNVSRQGLTGRRTQSSGNLCNGNKLLARDVGRILSSCSSADDKRLCGSLPNYLDDDRSNNNTSMSARLHEQKRGLELRLLPQQDLALQDQGYASERSPEDEHPPPLPPPEAELGAVWCLTQHYPFITPDALFEVTLAKGNRGLGLSVTGGVETAEQWPGLIRIKRLFPHQPAWQSGQLASGDILLAVNGVPLTGLTNYQALEVLRTSPSSVVLEMCRPPSDVFCVVAPSSEPPLPPRRDTSYKLSSSQLIAPLPLLQIEEPCGEFDIILQKVNRSLGFTLRKEDESVLGHYVRALVREPALSDGRIRPGDKIVEVNDVPLSPMSHEEAVTFLRQCGETVKLRLYRDAAQTPVAALSPSDPEPPGCVRPRPMLRQEARDMLTDLAVRKLSPTNSSSSYHGGGGGLLQCLSGGSTPGASPRRRRLTKTPSPDIATAARERLGSVYPAASSRVADSEREGEEEAQPQRPQFLDLQPDSGSPQTQRRPKYTFAVPEIRGGDEGLTEQPASLPPLSSTSTTSTAFSYRNPAYHSANPIRPPDEGEGVEAMTECSSERDVSGEGGEGSCGLLKWKGVVFTPGGGGGGGENERVLTVELTRGWNSRLGFSLRADGSRTYVSAVYADSVAAKDGRLRPHDRLITVNDENVEAMTTGEIIDLLRKIRGTIEIRVSRKSGPTLQSS